jgi:hypothetical protein
MFICMSLLPIDPAQSYPLPYSHFANTTLFSPLLLLLPSISAPEPTRLAADVACSVEAKGLTSQLAPVLKMCNRQWVRQRIWRRWRWDLCDISFCPGLSWIYAAAPRCPHSRPYAGTPPPPWYSTTSSSALTSLHSSKQQADAMLKAHVASLRFKCFRCFIRMLQVFYMDVAKVSGCCICCKLLLFPTFHLFSKRMLQVCLFRCCICFTHLLQVFYLGVAQ